MAHGRSNAYIEEHKLGIEKASKKITHYKWSLVGNILNELPGEESVILDIKDKSKELSIFGNYGYEIFGRHSTSSLIFDENGKAKRGERDYFSEKTQTLTNLIDDLGLGLLVYSFSEFAVYDLVEPDKNGNVKLTPYGITFITATILLVLSLTISSPDFAQILINALIKILINVIVDSAIYLYNKYGDKIILVVTNEIKKIDNSISNTVDNIKYELLKIWQNTKDVFSKSIYTYSYISENPYINVDTDLLREYANRLAKLSSKINSVNKRMKTLYYNVGLVDLFNLIQADILANYNYKIDSCKNYLNNTANSFEEAERNIISSFE